MNSHFRLIVGSRAEDFALVARDCRIGFNQLRHYATHRLNTHRQRRHIQQYDVAHSGFLIQDSPLDRSTYRYDLIWIYTFRRSLAEEIFY